MPRAVNVRKTFIKMRPSLECLAALLGCVSFCGAPPKVNADTGSELDLREAVTTKALTHNNRTLFYAYSGDTDQNVAVLFVHGSSGRWSAFAEYLNNSAQADKAVLMSYDRSGWGELLINDTKNSVLPNDGFEIGQPRWYHR